MRPAPAPPSGSARRPAPPPSVRGAEPGGSGMGLPALGALRARRREPRSAGSLPASRSPAAQDAGMSEAPPPVPRGAAAPGSRAVRARAGMPGEDGAPYARPAWPGPAAARASSGGRRAPAALAAGAPRKP